MSIFVVVLVACLCSCAVEVGCLDWSLLFSDLHGQQQSSGRQEADAQSFDVCPISIYKIMIIK